MDRWLVRLSESSMVKYMASYRADGKCMGRWLVHLSVAKYNQVHEFLQGDSCIGEASAWAGDLCVGGASAWAGSKCMTWAVHGQGASAQGVGSAYPGRCGASAKFC
eukprot:scaffold178336_cov19-Tisochrysis_lutea.AAC.1